MDTIRSWQSGVLNTWSRPWFDLLRAIDAAILYEAGKLAAEFTATGKELADVQVAWRRCRRPSVGRSVCCIGLFRPSVGVSPARSAQLTRQPSLVPQPSPTASAR